jgi:hypothetical protein
MSPTVGYLLFADSHAGLLNPLLIFGPLKQKNNISGVPDVIISDDIHGVLQLYNNRNRVRLFAVFRHPMERAISKYYADLGTDPEVTGMTLPQVSCESFRVCVWLVAVQLSRTPHFD